MSRHPTEPRSGATPGHLTELTPEWVLSEIVAWSFVAESQESTDEPRKPFPSDHEMPIDGFAGIMSESRGIRNRDD